MVSLVHYYILTFRKYGTKTYEGEGKTTANILNDEPGAGVMINGYSQVKQNTFIWYIHYHLICVRFYFQAGFRLNNDMTVLGPMAVFPR